MTTANKIHTNGAAQDLGSLFLRSKAFKEFNGIEGPEAHLDFEAKALFQTSAGWSPDVVRANRVELTPERALSVAQLPTLSETSQSAAQYMEETAATKNAAEVAEGGAYPGATFELTEMQVLIRKISVFLPVSEEQFQDEPRARDYVNSRLVRAINERADSQLLNGNGTAPNIRGYLNTAGIQTQPLGGDTVLTAVRKAITLVRINGFAEPDAVVFHPTDFETVQLEAGTGGLYAWGFPAEGQPQGVWGVPVVLSTAIPAGTALVGAFRAYSEFALRQGVDIQVSNSHSDYFASGKLAVRADFRAALVVARPAAYCQVTGL